MKRHVRGFGLVFVIIAGFFLFVCFKMGERLGRFNVYILVSGTKKKKKDLFSIVTLLAL